MPLTRPIVGNAAGGGGAFSASIQGIAAGLQPLCLCLATVKGTTGLLYTIQLISRDQTVSGRVTHLRLICTSGNIAAGTFYLYGEE